MRSPALPSPKQLAWLIVKTPDTRSNEGAAAITRVEQDAEAATVVRSIRRFIALVCDAGAGGRPRRLDAPGRVGAGLADAKTCGVRAVETFAVGLESDGAAVCAALVTSWSNGQAEGQITKLKLLKRSMYGRANLDLLRQRLLLAA